MFPVFGDSAQALDLALPVQGITARRPRGRRGAVGRPRRCWVGFLSRLRGCNDNCFGPSTNPQNRGKEKQPSALIFTQLILLLFRSPPATLGAFEYPRTPPRLNTCDTSYSTQLPLIHSLDTFAALSRILFPLRGLAAGYKPAVRPNCSSTASATIPRTLACSRPPPTPTEKQPARIIGSCASPHITSSARKKKRKKEERRKKKEKEKKKKKKEKEKRKKKKEKREKKKREKEKREEKTENPPPDTFFLPIYSGVDCNWTCDWTQTGGA